jgi:hypothetical protein
MQSAQRLQAIVERCLTRGVLLTRAKYIADELFPPPPSIRLCLPASLKEADARRVVATLVDVAAEVGKLSM